MSQDVIPDESRPTDLLGQNQSAPRAWQARQAIQKQQHPLRRGMRHRENWRGTRPQTWSVAAATLNPHRLETFIAGNQGQEGNSKPGRFTETHMTMAAYRP